MKRSFISKCVHKPEFVNEQENDILENVLVSNEEEFITVSVIAFHQ